MRTYLNERTRNTLCLFVYAFMNVPLPREVYTNIEMCLCMCEIVFLCVRSCVFACLRACVVSCACVRACDIILRKNYYLSLCGNLQIIDPTNTGRTQVSTLGSGPRTKSW